jgi:hypothetical protein
VGIRREWHPSPNYYSGYTSRRLITVHTSEGATTNQSLANFITQASAQVSYSISVDNSSKNLLFEYVKPGNSPWSQVNYNQVAVTGCFCTPGGASANWSRDHWLNTQRTALENMAQWVKEEASRWSIPLVALNNSQAQGSGRGVCQHSSLGAGGGGHYDCGPGFPMDELIRLAKGGAPAKPEVTETEEDDVGYLQFKDGKAPIAIPNQFRDGKSRLRFYTNTTVTIRLDWPGNPNQDRHLEYNRPDGAEIPETEQAVLIRLQDGDPNPVISYCFSK